MHAQDIMSSPAVAVTANTGVSRAADILAQRGFSAMPVIDNTGGLVGVVSEADLIRNSFTAPVPAVDGGAGSWADRPAQKVGEVMTSPATSVDHLASMGTIAETMVSGHRRTVPVVDGNILVGVITRGDIMRSLARSDASIALDIRRRLRGLGDPDRWSVNVSNGEATILDNSVDRSDRSVVLTALEAVPGVRHVTVSG